MSIWARGGGVLFANLSHDTYGKVRICVRGGAENVSASSWCDGRELRHKVRVVSVAGGVTEYEINGIRPFSVGMLK